MLNKDNGIRGVLRKISHSGIFGFYIAMVIAMSIISPHFLSMRNFINILLAVSSAAIVGVGMTMVMVSGNIDLSVGSIACICAIVLAKANKFADGLGVTGFQYVLLGIVVPIIIALLVGAIIGLINGSVLTLTGIPPFIMTFGMMQIIRGFAYVAAGTEKISIFPQPIVYIGSGKLFGFVPMPIIITIVLVLIFSFLMKYTKFGRYVYALGGNKVTLQLSGVNTRYYEIAVFVVSGLMSAIAGIIIVGRLNMASPSLCEGYEFDAIAAAVIGGTSMNGGEGKILGTFWGAIVVGTIRNALTLLNVSTNPQMIAIGAVIIIGVIFDNIKKQKAVTV